MKILFVFRYQHDNAEYFQNIHKSCCVLKDKLNTFPIKGFQYNFDIRPQYEFANILQSFGVRPPQAAHQNKYTNLHGCSFSREFVVILMTGLWRFHDETLQIH